MVVAPQMLLWADPTMLDHLDWIAHYQLEISAQLSRLWKFSASYNVVNAALSTG
jgi:hypothetical protein